MSVLDIARSARRPVLDLTDLDSEERADVEDVADELRRGGRGAVSEWRKDMERGKDDISERDRQLVELAI